MIHTPAADAAIAWPTVAAADIISGERLQAIADVAVTIEVRRAYHHSAPEMPMAVFRPDFEPEPERMRLLEAARVVFVYSDMVDGFLRRILPHLRQPIVLISHNSDAAVEARHLPVLETGAVRHWFAQNAMVRHPRLTALPIGVANAQWPHGDATLLSAIAAENATAGADKRPGVYANFSVATNKAVRGPLHAALRHKPFVAFPRVPWTAKLALARLKALARGRTFDATRTPLPPAVYLRDLARWRYCVSPPGNGADCHRTWEALYLGCVPVVSTVPPGLLDGLPHVRMDDLAAMTLDGLDAALAAMARPFAFETLRLAYWRDRIRSAAGEVSAA